MISFGVPILEANFRRSMSKTKVLFLSLWKFSCGLSVYF